jgi:predicted Zn-dependent protease
VSEAISRAKEVVHEIGHTLGLRHNFKSSTMLSIDEMNDTAKTRDTGLTGSVMDTTRPT